VFQKVFEGVEFLEADPTNLRNQPNALEEILSIGLYYQGTSLF
jgi:hypothetical protein